MSLRNKLFIFAFLICTVPLLLLGFFWFNTSEKTLTESTYRELDSVNQLSINLIREWASGSLTLLESLAQRPLVIASIETMLANQDALTVETRNLLDNHFLPALQMQGDLKSLSILDLNGKVLVSSDPRQVGGVHNRADFFIHGQTGSFIGNVVHSAEIGEPVMHVAHPIRSRSGRTIAVLSGHLNWKRASELLSMPVTGSPTLESYLVNRDAIMLTDSKFVPDAPLRVNVDSEGVKSCFENGNGHGSYPDYRGVEVLGVSTWLPERDVCLLTEKDVAELAAPLQQLKARFYVVTLLLGGLAALIALAIARTISGPIRQLADAVRSSGSGSDLAPLKVSKHELGQIARAFNESQDARQIAEEENRRLIAILEHAPQLVAIADPDGRISYLNNAGHHWLGLKIGQDLNLKMAELQPEWANRIIHNMAVPTAVESGFWFGETAFLRPDANERPVMQVVMAHRHPDGKVSHYSTIAFDLSERKQLEEELHRHQQQLEKLVEVRTQTMVATQAKFRAYFENAQIGMAITSLDRQWEETNNRLCEMLGYSQVELANLTWEDLTHPDDLASDRAKFDKLLDGTEDSYSLEKRFICKSGEIIYTMLTVACVRKEDGSPDYFAATIQDISLRKQAENRLKEALQVLAASNRELEQFAYVASHDLQEPLRTITSYIQLIERRFCAELDDDAQEFINYVVEAAARMKTLINDLLEYSRIGRKDLPNEDVDLNQVVANISSQIQLSIDETGTELQVDHLPTLRGVRSQFNQLFHNLISNAIKFRRKDVPLTIRISAKEIGEFWEISLQDNGIGIEAQYFDRIFTIFQRLHTVKEYPGTGIGLAQCKKIVERYKGTIHLQSIPGEGTTFIIRLPKGESHGEHQRPTD